MQHKQLKKHTVQKECRYFRQNAAQSLDQDRNDLLLETSRALSLPQLPTVVVHLEKGFQTNIRC